MYARPARQARTNPVPHYFSRIPDYWFHGPQRRFARDAGVSESVFSRMLKGEDNPSAETVCRVVDLLERKLGTKIDPRDLYRL